jgi:hypothetical protein
MELSSTEIERRRNNANTLVAQGRLGGAEFGRLGGRPRKPRAAEMIAEKVAGEADTFFERLKEIVETGGEANAINSIKTLLQIEENERQIIENEELRFEQLKRDELIKYLTTAFGELQDQGFFPGGIADAEFEPVKHPEIEGNGSSDSGTTETS